MRLFSIIKAVVWLVVGVFLIGACGSYQAGDASWNTAGAVVHNLGGRLGSTIADLLWQSIGVLVWFLCVACVCFGMYRLCGHKIRWRFALIIPMLLLGCWLVEAKIEMPTGEVFHRGGVVGFWLNRIYESDAVWLKVILWAIWCFAGIYLLAIPVRTLLKGSVRSLKYIWGLNNQRRVLVAVGLVVLGCVWMAVERYYLKQWGENHSFGKSVLSVSRMVYIYTASICLIVLGSSALCQKRSFAVPGWGRVSALMNKTEKMVEPLKKVKIKKAKKKTDAVKETTETAAANQYNLPDVDLLNPAKTMGATITKEAMNQISKALEAVLAQFGISGQIVGANPGPVVTLYEFEPASGVKTSRVIALSDDIAREMRVLSVRIAVVPGSNVIGIEMPNPKRDTVYIRELVESTKFKANTGALPLILGKDIGGGPTYADLAKMPHLLVAGTTGSGKSVAINTMILSLLYRFTPAECRLILVDPKMVELSVYNHIPHLLTPVVTEAPKAVVALKWAVREMEDRYRAMSQLGVRNIDGYNQKLRQAAKEGRVLTRRVQTGFDANTGKPVFEEQPFDLTPIPYIVMIVDEMSDLMGQCGKEAEPPILRLAQMARAVGIHLILATQRPSVDVITGLIKANFPTRISFQVTNKIDSRTILDEQGAEQLLGRGDMLYRPAGSKPIRLHGPFVSDEEVEKVVQFWRSQGEPQYVDAVITETEDMSPAVSTGSSGIGDGDGEGNLYDRAVDIVLKERKVSTSYIQRRLRIGYNRAATLVEQMEAEGVISKPNIAGKREVLAPDPNG